MKYEGTVTYQEIEFEVKGDYIPFTRGKQYLRNGDPGYPDEGDCFEEFDILIGGKSIHELLTASAAEAIEKLAAEDARTEGYDNYE